MVKYLWFITLSIIAFLFIKKIIKYCIVKYRRSKIKLIKGDKKQGHIEQCWNEINN